MITIMWQADNCVKNWQNLPIRNPKWDLHNINAHTKFCKNGLIFTQVIVRKLNKKNCDKQITLSKIVEICL